MTARVHHSAIVVSDIDASLRFWRDGVGFEVIMDMHFDGDWRTLFGAPGNRLRSVFLGDRGRADAGIVELVQFDEGSGDPPVGPPVTARGFFLLSCYVDVEAVLGRLRALDVGGEPRRIVVPGPGEPLQMGPVQMGPVQMGAVQMATVVDPDGVLVELIGVPSP